MTFFDAAPEVTEWRRTAHEGRRAQLALRHLMASVAIPGLFPPEWIDTEHFGDGAMRQLAPLAPAVRLGAERILIIGVRAPRGESAALESCESRPPGIGELFGFMLDTLFGSQVLRDLEQLETMNALAELAPGSGPRSIQALRISPEEDLGRHAADCVQCLPRTMRALLGVLGSRRGQGDAQQLFAPNCRAGAVAEASSRPRVVRSIAKRVVRPKQRAGVGCCFDESRAIGGLSQAADG